MWRIWCKDRSQINNMAKRLEGLGVKASWIQVIEERQPLWIEAALTMEQKLQASLDPLVNVVMMDANQLGY
jgi:hypothetical protein